MKVRDFEKSIGELNCSIVLDMVKINKGQVHRFFGHKGCTQIMWDEFGRGYSFEYEYDADSKAYDNTEEAVTDRMYERTPVFDLNFS